MKRSLSIEKPDKLSRKARLIGFVIIGLCLLFTYLLWAFFTFSNEKNAADRLEADTNVIIDILEDRMEVSTDVLYGGRAIFLTQPALTREQWDVYVNSQNIFERYSSLNNLLYAKAEGPDQAVITYLAQKTPVSFVGVNLREIRQFAITMDEADITSSPTASPPYDSPIPDRKGTKDVLLFLAIYNGTYRPEMTDEQKHAAVTGYIAASIHPKTLFQYALSTLPDKDAVRIKVVDQNNTVLYEEGTVNNPLIFERDVKVDVGGQQWVITFTAARNYELSLREMLAPYLFVIGGMIFMVLLVSVYFYRQGIRVRVNASKKEEKQQQD